MCVPGLDPVTMAMVAATTAASAGGAAYNANIQNDAVQAQDQADRQAMKIANRQAEAERVRQAALERESAAKVAEALTAADPSLALVRARQVARSDMNPITSAGAEPAVKPQFENKVVSDATSGYEAESAARTREVTEALAMLAALGQGMTRSGSAIQLAGSGIDSVNSKRQGSMRVSQLETGIPSATVTPSDSIVGDMLLTAGEAGGRMTGARLNKTGLPDIGSIFTRKGKSTPPIFASGGMY